MNEKPWSYRQLEALHAMHMIECMFEQFVLESDFVEDKKSLSEKAEVLQLEIANMYQAIGNEKDND